MELGHDVTGQQLVAAIDLFPGCPVFHPNHEGAKSAAHLLKAMDLGDTIVGRPDDPLVVLAHVVHDVFVGCVGVIRFRLDQRVCAMETVDIAGLNI